MAWYTHSTDVGTHGPCVLLSNIGLYFEEYGDTKDNSIRGSRGRDRYEANRKIYRDNLATEQWALEMGEKKGRQIGLEEGIQIGQKRGIQIGREEGMLDAARGMKAAGIAPELIARITGLSMEEIQKL